MNTVGQQPWHRSRSTCQLPSPKHASTVGRVPHGTAAEITARISVRYIDGPDYLVWPFVDVVAEEEILAWSALHAAGPEELHDATRHMA